MPTRARLPKRVRVGADIVEIETRPEGDNLFEAHDSTHHSLGAFDHTMNQLRLRDLTGQSLSQQRDSLLHELIHGAVRKANLHHGILKKGDREEQLVAQITPWLLGILRDNPAVVAFLLEKD